MTAPKPKAKNTTPQHWFDRMCLKLFGTTINLGDFQQIAKNNYQLGLTHMGKGNMRDAIMRFRMVLWLEPSHKLAWYQLGQAYLKNGQPANAANAFRKAIKVNPKNEEAAYMMAIALGDGAEPKDLPKKIPVSLAVAHFDKIASEYSNEQLITYKYKGHVLLPNAVKEEVITGRKGHVILDLGCGTGLLGPELRPIASQLVGVDFSEKMLDEAAKRLVEGSEDKKIYDALVRREAHDYLRESAAEAYDIIVAANTLNFIGELKPLFVQVSQALKEGGLFAILVDIQRDGQDFSLRPSEGRFHFSKPYLSMTATLAGLKLVKIEEAPIYPNDPMWLGIFRK